MSMMTDRRPVTGWVLRWPGNGEYLTTDNVDLPEWSPLRREAHVFTSCKAASDAAKTWGGPLRPKVFRLVQVKRTESALVRTAEEERADVVAMLRDRAKRTGNADRAMAFYDACSAFERGEHVGASGRYRKDGES